MSESPRYVRREIVIDAPPERVLDAWADPREISRWYTDDALGDARTARSVAWMLGGETYPFEVTAYKVGQRLELTNVGSEPWKGTVIAVETIGEPAGTRTIVTQTGISEALRDHVANVDTGWACMLAILKQYVERHWGEPRTREEATRAVPLDPAVVAEAFQSAEGMARWAGERPTNMAFASPRGAVATFAGFPGVFGMMGTTEVVEACEITGGVLVSYCAWGEAPATGAPEKVESLADAFVTWAGSESVARGFGVRRR